MRKPGIRPGVTVTVRLHPKTYRPATDKSLPADGMAMSGIVFFGSNEHDRVVEFYTEIMRARVWLKQSDCTILQYDNQLLGFCDREDADTDGIVTFVRSDREGVDELYDRLSEQAHAPPEENERYEIYQFFADDPEGRTVEVQTFLHPTPPV